MKKLVTFSLWGNDPIYTQGAIENAKLIPEIYGDSWVSRFYISKDVSVEIVESIDALLQTECIVMDEPANWFGMFWRFFAMDDSDIAVFRDTDSRPTHREHLAVEEWISSEKTLHIMRDHPYHSEPIMGGMWGCRSQQLLDMINKNQHEEHGIPRVNTMRESMQMWLDYRLRTMKEINHNTKGIDQQYLREVIYPYSYMDSVIHDSFPMYNCWSNLMEGNPRPAGQEKQKILRGEQRGEDSRGFPVNRPRSINGDGKVVEINFNDFVGQVYDENNTPNKEYSKILKERDDMIYRDWERVGELR